MVNFVDLLRAVSLGILIIATLIDPKPFSFMTLTEVQVVLAAFVVFTILFVDHIFGFIIALSLISIYSRVFMDKYGISLTGSFNNTSSKVTPYVTAQNLLDAQNNVVGDETKPYGGIADAGYTAQGVQGTSSYDKLVPGFPNEPYENIGPFKKDGM